MYAVPDPPVDVIEEMADRSETTVGLYWSDGADSGGWPVEDYKVTITSSDGLYSMEIPGLTEKLYKAEGLTLGVTYYFQI